MRKRLSLLVALAISLTISTTSLAAAPIVSSATDSTNSATSVNISDLTLDAALNDVESNSIVLKSMDKTIDSLNKRLANDKMKVIATDANGKSQSQYPNGQYVQVMIQKEVTPVRDQQSIDDEKNSKDEKLNSIKFDLEKQYMNAITAKDQVDNINKNIADLDEQIKQTQAKIDAGQLTKDLLNPIKVQKSTLLSQLATPNILQQQSILNIKRYLNIDLNGDLKLATAKKDFVKFDDTDIESKIKADAQKDYNLNSIQKNIDVQKIQVDVQTKYAYNSLTEPINSQLTLEDLQNKVVDTSSNLEVNLWKAYYTLKNKEDAVQSQVVAQESAQMSYDKANETFNNGMIDKVTLDSAELALSTAKVSTQKSINDYMIVQEQFNYALNGHGSTAASIQ